MKCRDWRDAAGDDVRPLYAAERDRWRAALSWDPADAFAVVEDGRVAGHVAGWIAEDEDGSPAGWTFYILHDSVLQIGGLVAERPAVTRCLLDAILSSPEASLARGLTCFLFPDAGGAASALTRQRFSLRESLYLSRPLDLTWPAPSSKAPSAIRPHSWSPADLAATVRVLAAAYQDVPSAVCFAPDGRREQWANYTWQLVKTPGCGRFDPTLSRISCAPGSTEAAGVALVSWIAADTVHVPQIAVAPNHRRSGVAVQLLESALTAAKEAGAVEVTLMVDADNAPALALYGRLGFRQRARMLYGSRAARNRVAA